VGALEHAYDEASDHIVDLACGVPAQAASALGHAPECL
jgi:hypothetical protein